MNFKPKKHHTKFKISALFLTLIALLLSNNLLGQDLESVTDGIEEKKIDEFKFAREFASIATGNAFSSIGNFASVSTKAETLSASLIFMPDNGNVWSIALSGGATQGVTALFDEGDLNSNVSIGGSYNILLRKSKNAIVTNSTSEDIIKLEIASENRKYQGKLLEHLEGKYENEILKDTARINKLIIKLEREKDSIKNLLNIAQLAGIEKIKIENFINDTTALYDKVEQSKTLLENLLTRKIAVSPIKQFEILNALANEHDKKVLALKAKIYALKPDAVAFSWISVGLNFKNSSFKLFDPTLDLDKQVFSEDYNSFSTILSYNHLSNVRVLDKRITGKIDIEEVKNKPREYFSIGLKFDYTDNLSTLQQVEITDNEVIDETSGRTKTVKQNAFIGEYENDLDNLTVFADYYHFLTKDDKLAIHLNPKVLIREKFKPVSSFQIGMLVPFKNKDKQSTTLNLEFFYRIKDIFNTTENDNSLLNRNLIGVQASFPFIK